MSGPARVRRVAVTGSSGFVGRALCRRLVADGVQVRALVRHRLPAPVSDCELMDIGDLARPGVDWAAALADVDAVVHLAAVAHAPDDDALRRINVEATERLARAAFAAGIALVHASTVKVHGESSPVPLDERAALQPEDAYGRSKRDAELAIDRAARELGGRWIGLRPPIVYGPGERHNFARLVRLACSGWPLPLAGLTNRRSMIHVDVLADALAHAIACTGAMQGAFLVGGGPALSTSDWLQAIADAAGCRCRLFGCPPGLLRTVAAAAGSAGVARRLLGTLEVDDTRWRAQSGWFPPRSQPDAIVDAVRALRRAG